MAAFKDNRQLRKDLIEISFLNHFNDKIGGTSHGCLRFDLLNTMVRRKLYRIFSNFSLNFVLKFFNLDNSSLN